MRYAFAIALLIYLAVCLVTPQHVLNAWKLATPFAVVGLVGLAWKTKLL